MENGLTPKETYLQNFTYTGPELSISQAKEIVSRYPVNSGSVDLEKDANGFARICLNNPRYKNAVNGKMMTNLYEIVEKLEQWTECKGAIMYGADDNFCSGGDLNMARQMNNPEFGYAMSTYMGHILDRFNNLPMITVAYINGSGAIGGGAEMAMACDYRLMCTERPTTVIRFIHGRLGIVPAWGTSGRLMSALGPRKTMDVLLESRPMDAANAMDAGLVDGTAASLADVAEWLTRKTRHDVNVIRAIKRTRQCYDGGVERPTAAALMESRIFAPLWGGTANREALNKFFEEKR